MSNHKTNQGFEFETSLRTIFLLRAVGLAFLWIGIPGPGFIAKLSWDELPYFIAGISITLFWWAAGLATLYYFADIQIRDGEISFRRNRHRSRFPLQAIKKVKVFAAGLVYLRVKDARGSHTILFIADNLEFGPSPPPVIQFLRDAVEAGSVES